MRRAIVEIESRWQTASVRDTERTLAIMLRRAERAIRMFHNRAGAASLYEHWLHRLNGHQSARWNDSRDSAKKEMIESVGLSISASDFRMDSESCLYLALSNSSEKRPMLKAEISLSRRGFTVGLRRFQVSSRLQSSQGAREKMIIGGLYPEERCQTAIFSATPSLFWSYSTR